MSKPTRPWPGEEIQGPEQPILYHPPARGRGRIELRLNRAELEYLLQRLRGVGKGLKVEFEEGENEEKEARGEKAGERERTPSPEERTNANRSLDPDRRTGREYAIAGTDFGFG